MNLNKLEKILEKEPVFRLKQAKQALFVDFAENWSQAITLPLALRQELEKDCPIDIKAENFISKDGKTIKALIELADGLKVETVLMRHADRNTVCVSSQIGCPLGCAFCATGKMGFKRNLSEWEIVEQVLHFARLLREIKSLFTKGGLRGILKNKSSPTLLFQRRETNRITSIVFMGMGEPFLNYENVIRAIKILNDKDGFNLGARHFSISTVGIVEGIAKLADEPLQINLAISLHAPDDKLRSEIMPINKKYPLAKVLSAVDDYIAKTRRRVMLEYIMIKDVNDSDDCAAQLAKIAKRPLCFMNLISYNPTGIFSPSNPKRIAEFKKKLEGAGVDVTQRYRFGRDVKGACGQLAGN